LTFAFPEHILGAMGKPPKAFRPYRPLSDRPVHDVKKLDVMRKVIPRVAPPVYTRFLVTMDVETKEMTDMLAALGAMTRSALIRSLIRSEAVRRGIVSPHIGKRLPGP